MSMAKNIIIRRNKNGDIYSVDSPLRYTEKYTEEEVLQKIRDANAANATLSENVFPYEIIQVDDLAGQIMEFLLGDGKYKRQHEISDLCDSLERFHDAAEDVRGELDDISDVIYNLNESIVSMRKNIAEKFNVELD